MFGKSKGGKEPEINTPEIDPILDDLLRGVEGRESYRNFLPSSHFEDPDILAKKTFTDHSGDNFLGVVNAHTALETLPNGREEYVTRGGTPIGVSDDRHRTLLAGSRSGKGRQVIVPELLTYSGSMVVIDPKGENASITARYRAETLGQNVHIVDPFKVTKPHCKGYRSQFNPLQTLNENSDTFFEDVGLIADAIVVTTNKESAHWDETAKALIEGLIIFVKLDTAFSEEETNLMTVAGLLTGKKYASIETLLLAMIRFGGLHNSVAAAAQALKEMGDNERGSVLSTARRNLKFLSYDSMWNALQNHDFNLKNLKDDKPMTVYLVLPTMRMSTCRQFLRIFVNLTLAAVEKNLTRPKLPVQLILDEMATLGTMKELENAIGQVAGLGLRITCILQDLGQLKYLYEARYETFLGNSGLIQCFGNVDYYTSKWISNYLGSTTIRYQEKMPLSGGSKVQSKSETKIHTKTLELMTPAEVRRWFARGDQYNRQLILIPGERPWITQRANYDTHELFQGRFDEWH